MPITKAESVVLESCMAPTHSTYDRAGSPVTTPCPPVGWSHILRETLLLFSLGKHTDAFGLIAQMFKIGQ
jgi:hypothetical protein